MIDYVKGRIAELTPTQTVIDNGGIGYIMEISLQTYDKMKGKSEATVYVQTQVNQREGTEVDYGFADKEERDLFRLITSVSGMGASSARMVLSSLTADELRNALLAEDINKIKSIKGIGLKTAQRLILELKDKIIKGSEVSTDMLFASEANANTDEATSALVMLGFSKPNIAKAIQKVLKDKPDAKVEEIIKGALKLL